MLRFLTAFSLSAAVTSIALGQAGVGNEVPPLTYYRYYQQPWYTEPGVRQQLKLTDEQLQKLNSAYTNAYSGLNTSLSGLKDLAEADRQERIRKSYTNFYTGLNAAKTDVMTPEQVLRYNQLWSQYRGYDALLDPANVDRLKLSEAQRRALEKLDQQYLIQMNKLNSVYPTNRDAAIASYKTMQPDVSRQINDLLTPEQRATWSEMVGAPYRFEPFYGYSLPK